MELHKKIKSKFPYLDDQKLLEIVNMGEMLALKEGEVFVEAGTRTNKVALVVQGIMRNYIVNDKGEEVTVVLATEMQAIAPYATVFLGKPATETSVAVEPTVLLVMDFFEFKKRAESDIIVMRLYAELIELAFVAAIERVEDFTQKKPEQRYRRLLDIHGFLIERVPLKYLASYLGITAVSLSRIRKRVGTKRN